MYLVFFVHTSTGNDKITKVPFHVHFDFSDHVPGDFALTLAIAYAGGRHPSRGCSLPFFSRSDDQSDAVFAAVRSPGDASGAAVATTETASGQ